MRKSVYSKESEILAIAMLDARRKSGLHQTDLAERMGCDQSAISNIERGQRLVDLIEFYNLAKAMVADPERLFGSLIAK